MRNTIQSLLLLTICFPVVAFAQTGSEDQRSIRESGFEVSFKAGNEADADMIAGFMRQSVAELVKEFKGHNAERILNNSLCRVIIHATPDERASEATASLISNYDGPRCMSELHILAPNAHGPAARTVTDEPKDAYYFHKLIMHEYCTSLLGAISRDKPTGWRFNSSPAWFVQGYEEYLALFHSSEHSRTVTYGKYLAEVKRNPARVSMDFGVDVQDPYVDGTVLLKFMHDVWGADRVQAILKSPEPTFGKAAKTSLGVTFEEFADRWNKWLAEQP